MRKILATILSLCTLTAFAMPKTALRHADADSAQTPAITSPSQSNNLTKNSVKASSLLSPNTYEQYLSLSSPTDVAVFANYTVIADGNTIFVYNRRANAYYKYTHGENSVQHTVTKLQFDDNERLYFLDATTTLYSIDPQTIGNETAAATKTELVCSMFAIQGNRLYYTNTSGSKSQISYAPLSDLTFGASTLLVENLTLTPILAFYQNELYYTNSGKYLNKISTDGNKNETFVTAFSSDLLSLSIINGGLYCTTREGDFFSYNLSALSENKQANDVKPLDTYKDGFSSIAVYGGYVYLLRNTSVLQYSLQTSNFTDFEIGSSSSAQQRFQNATDITIGKNKLFLTDVGNERISIYDLDEGCFTQPISTTLSAQYIASDDQTVLIASQTDAQLYDLADASYGKQIPTSQHFNGNLVGVVNVYGTYYLATDKNYFYTLSKNESTLEWTWTSAQKNFSQYPSHLTADVHGNLYVACGSNVYTYTETTFATNEPSTNAILTGLPENIEKIQTDYRSNLYVLKNNTVYKYTAPQTPNGTYQSSSTFALNDSLVYGSESAVQSFALSMKENAAYVLYKDNFLGVTDKLQMPTIQNIFANDFGQNIFENTPTEFTVVQAAENALMVEFDLNALETSTVFPYLSHKRITTPITALKIGQIDVYDVIAVYNESKAKYNTFLVYSSYCTEYPTDGYKIIYTEAEQRIGYLSNAASIYSLPYASSIFSTHPLLRGDGVTLLGEIVQLDKPYYYVSYTTEDGETKMGYIPKAYVTPTNSEFKQETLVFGDTITRKDAYGRLIYILFGTATICALVDYLILRKPQDEEAEENNEKEKK